jgi:oxygen-independent coproporphyrinogen-3 oxidase
MNGVPLTGEPARQCLNALRERKRSGKSVCYVHVPFCETRCLYCGFYGGRYTPETGDAYLDALLLQLARDKDSPCVRSGPVHALYLGGGTPTALSAEQLERLLAGLREVLPLANDCEITVESRIHGFTPEKMLVCIDAGVNRFSLGVQSFNTALRRRIGRLDDRRTVIACLERLAAFDHAAVVVDLIYGLPGQTPEDWEEDLRIFLSLPADGVDLYPLTVFPGGALQEALARGTVPPVADLAAQSEYFSRGVGLMSRAGLRRLSITHWGKNSRERNLYNPLSKSRADCLAYGSGAGGVLHGHFFLLDSSPGQYMERVARGEPPLALLATPPPDFPFMRAVLGQMEEGFLDLEALAGVGGSSRRLAPLLEAWEEGKLMERIERADQADQADRSDRTDRTGDRYRLTLAGQFWQVNLAQMLLSWHSGANGEAAPGFPGSPGARGGAAHPHVAQGA